MQLVCQTTPFFLFLLFGILLTGNLVAYTSPVFGEPYSGNLLEIETDDHSADLAGNEHLTKPTFGLNHETYKTIVDNGFRFNGKSFSINDNHHTPFEEQSVNIGKVNSFETTVYAEKGLRVQEFLFGIPIVGQAHLAELGVEVWYGNNGEIENVKTIQKSSVIDEDSIVATHKKTKCQASDIEQNCDTTKVLMVFLEPLRDKVMALKAIDYHNRYQITYLNEGFEVSGESINPMHTFMIPSDIKGEGLLQVTQTEKYSRYWMAEDGRTFERNDFGSFRQTDKSFERFQDTGEPRTRMHSGFGDMLDSEKSKATQVFDASLLISELPESFAYVFPEPHERLTEEVLQIMFLEEKIAKEILKQSDRQTRDY